MLAPRLKPGDGIGIVSPSGVIAGPYEEQLGRGVQVLERLGFRVVLAPNARARTLGYSATSAEKASDLHAMFRDPTVAAILCSQGGATANACLPLLDWELIRAHPKIFLGMSDISVLLNAIHARAGLVTFHGHDVMWGLGRSPKPYDLEELTARLVDGRIGPVRAAGPRETIRPGIAEGPLLGGHIDCLRRLLGTPYAPRFDGAILLLESHGFSADYGYAQLHHLDQAGVLGKIAGAVVGHVHGDPAAPSERMAQVLLEVARGYSFPILKISDFGHECASTILPIGARARLDADHRELELLEPCTRPSVAART